jgi:hypothetical protein
VGILQGGGDTAVEINLRGAEDPISVDRHQITTLEVWIR